MVRRALRVVLFASFAFVLWTMARPADAYAYAAHANAAPLCDDRGATSLAPPPALEAPDVAIRRARAPSSCAADGELPFFATVTAAHHRAPPPSADPAQALPLSSLRLAPLDGDDLADPVDAGTPLDGVRSRVDRPPRA